MNAKIQAVGSQASEFQQVCNSHEDAKIPIHRYSASVWSHGRHSDCLQESWKGLHNPQNKPGAVYQSPAFLDYLVETEGENSTEVLTVCDKSSSEILGVVPVRKSTIELPFAIGGRTITNLHLKGLTLLGSEPMVPQHPDALDSLFNLISQRYLDAQLVSMDAVSANSYLWKYIKSSEAIKNNFAVHVLHGFRDCHSVDLPNSTEKYYARLSKKRRYNFLRQEKLLQRHIGGGLELILIDTVSNIAELFRAMDCLSIATTYSSASNRAKLVAAARHGFLYCFVLKSQNKTIGLMLGTKSNKILRIHRFFHDKSLEKYSPGTTLWQMVLRYLINESVFINVDMGYGTPAYRYHATNVIRQKGNVLLVRRSLANRGRILAHSGFTSVVNFFKSGPANSG